MGMPVETAKQISEEDAQLQVRMIKAEMRKIEERKAKDSQLQLQMIKAEMRKIEERKAKQTPATVNKLSPGMVVRLKCHHTGKNLALNVDGSQDPTGIRSDGGHGDYAKWIVHGTTNAKAVRLQNFKHKNRWLRVMDNGTSNANGNLKEASETGDGKCGWFYMSAV